MVPNLHPLRQAYSFGYVSIRDIYEGPQKFHFMSTVSRHYLEGYTSHFAFLVCTFRFIQFLITKD